jgi:putative membrane protein
MRPAFLLVAAALAMLNSTALGQTAADRGGAQQDRTFIEQAALEGAALVRTAELAMARANDDRIRTFAQRLVEDQTPINQEIAILAGDTGIGLASTEPPPDAEPADLAGLKVAGFDRAWLGETVAAHERLVALFERQSAEGGDDRLRRFTANHLPDFQQKLTIVRSLADEIR